MSWKRRAHTTACLLAYGADGAEGLTNFDEVRPKLAAFHGGLVIREQECPVFGHIALAAALPPPPLWRCCIWLGQLAERRCATPDATQVSEAVNDTSPLTRSMQTMLKKMLALDEKLNQELLADTCDKAGQAEGLKALAPTPLTPTGRDGVRKRASGGIAMASAGTYGGEAGVGAGLGPRQLKRPACSSSPGRLPPRRSSTPGLRRRLAAAAAVAVATPARRTRFSSSSSLRACCCPQTCPETSTGTRSP